VAKSRVFEVKPDLAEQSNAPKVYHRNAAQRMMTSALPPTMTRAINPILNHSSGVKRLEQQTAGHSRITQCLFQSLKVLTQSFPPGTILET
jgi:hypothetical protein